MADVLKRFISYSEADFELSGLHMVGFYKNDTILEISERFILDAHTQEEVVVSVLRYYFPCDF